MERTAAAGQNIAKTFFKYVSLNVLSMAGLSLYILADTFFIANGVGEAGLVALNLVLPIYSVINGTGLLLGIGGATRYAIAVGEGHPERGGRIFTECVAIGAGLGALYTALGVTLAEPLARLFGASGDIVPLAVTYLTTISSFSVCFVMNNLLVPFVRNDNAPRLAMAAMLTASMANILLDYLLVYPAGLGMFGASFATGLSPIISMCVLSVHFFKRRNSFRLTRCRPDGREIGRIFAAGTPTFITEISSGVLILLFNAVTLSIAGNTGVAAYSVIANIALVCTAVFNGVGQGIQPIVSVSYGAGRKGDLKKTYFLACASVLVLAAVFYLAGLFGGGAITALFNPAGDERLASLAKSGIAVYFTSLFAMGLNIVTTSLFASVSRPKQSFLLSLLRGLIVVIPLLFTLPIALGITGVWLALPLAETAVALFAALLVARYFTAPRPLAKKERL